MKKLFKYGMGLVIAVLAAVSVQAQQYTTTTLVSNTQVREGSTSNFNQTVTLTKHEDVAFSIEFKSLASSNTALGVTTTIQRSLDGSNWATTGNWTITNTCNGTTLVHYITNYPASTLGPIGYLRVSSVVNADATNPITNLVIKATVKPVRNGGAKN